MNANENITNVQNIDSLDIQSRLMTIAEFNSIENLPHPFVYSITSNKLIKSKYPVELVYFGANHSTDIKDPQYSILTHVWKKFIGNKNPKDCLCLLSGGTEYQTNYSYKEAIREHCECGFVAKLAKDNNIQLENAEPNMAEVSKELEKQFTRDQIEYYYFAQVVSQWNRFQEEDKPDFTYYIEGFLTQDKQYSGWIDYDFSLTHMKQIHKDIFNIKLNSEDTNFFDSISNPYSNKSIINQVGRQQNVLRDESIVRNILKYINLGKNLFVVFGSAHAITQKKCLEYLLSI